ncbi:MAG: hypothetical protein EOO27_11205 [Comamonadaceae bacterium]|nr:MAG: hypothetical protein EOO27_11205 [Comamonadaceae bacterium]
MAPETVIHPTTPDASQQYAFLTQHAQQREEGQALTPALRDAIAFADLVGDISSGLSTLAELLEYNGVLTRSQLGCPDEPRVPILAPFEEGSLMRLTVTTLGMLAQASANHSDRLKDAGHAAVATEQGLQD